MKRLSLIILFGIFLAGCKITQLAIGMPETDFKKSHWGAEKVEMTADRTVYREAWNDINNEPHLKYYYFERGKLVRMDEGAPTPVLVVQHE